MGGVTLPTASARLAEVQGHGHTRPPRSATQEGRGRVWESQRPRREPGWLCLLTVRAPRCCLATKDVFCQRCRDGIGWGICFFLGHPPAKKSSALPGYKVSPGPWVPRPAQRWTPGNPGPPGGLVQRAEDRGGTRVSLQPALRAPELAQPLCNASPLALPGCQVSHEVIQGCRVLREPGSLLPAPSSLPAHLSWGCPSVPPAGDRRTSIFNKWAARLHFLGSCC